jgi:hypothetical protein
LKKVKSEKAVWLTSKTGWFTVFHSSNFWDLNFESKNGRLTGQTDRLTGFDP